MSTAAYCSACRAYVFVAEDGSCEAGHPKPMLRNLYEAQTDRKTGRPKPPKAKSARGGRRSQTSVPASPSVVTTAAVPVPPTAAVVAAASIAASAILEPTAAPAAPFPDQVASPACVPAEESAFARLFGTPRGRHSAVVIEDPNRRAVALMMVALILVAATVVAELAVGGDVFTALQQPAIVALAG